MSTQHTYQVKQIVDEIPPAQRGRYENAELAAVRATARANPGRYVEIVTSSKSMTSLSGEGFKFLQRGDRRFVIYTNGTSA